MEIVLWWYQDEIFLWKIMSFANQTSVGNLVKVENTDGHRNRSTFPATDQFYGSLIFPRCGPFRSPSLFNRDPHGHAKVIQL